MIGWIKSFFGAEKKEEAAPAPGQQAAPAVAPAAPAQAPAQAPAASTEAPAVPVQAGGARRKHRASHRNTKKGGAKDGMGLRRVGGKNHRNSKKRHTHRRHRK